MRPGSPWPSARPRTRAEGQGEEADEPDEVLATTDGRLLDHLEARVVGPDGGVRDGGMRDGGMRDGAVREVEGELQVRGVSVTSGYTDPAQDAAAFTADGWFRTGDLVRLAPSGHVTVTGRLKDVILRKGETISAIEVEELLASCPGVAEAAVVGVPDPDRGELVCAVVRPADPASPPTLTDVVAWLRGAGLMVQKLPERLELVERMPLTGLGKVAKAELRVGLAAGSPA
ncbi:AMP-binding enzyme [Pseudonocardia pini]|uniref:AMP-binding enzyme n=1 Tax=Pseudonocardia pini TaxID=2758030 RepID=UPI001C693CBB|nr:AMP-binding protein [Pseudonocardia pini]